MNNITQNNNIILFEKEKKIKKSIYDKEYRLKNKEKILKRNKEYNARSEVKEHRKKYYNIKNKTKKEYISKQKREYNSRPEVKEHRIKRQKFYISNPKIAKRLKEYRKQYNCKTENIIKRRNYYNNRLKQDPLFKLSKTIRCRFLKAIKKSYKNTSCIELLGCSIEEFKKYIESIFKDGMTWQNHGKFGWHIDHIKPCSRFNLSDIEQQKQCFHYSNLQPLWWWENLKKSNN